MTYIAVAVAGNAQDRRIYREARQQRARRGAVVVTKPVALQRVRPHLQLWVAACMSAAFEDTRRVALWPHSRRSRRRSPSRGHVRDTAAR
ncbi:hypothetical protein ACWEH3_10900 [Nocardia sp. NPDC004718]